MTDKPRYRHRQVTFSAEERKAYKAQAEAIDHHEKQAILADARRTKARMEMLRVVLQQLKAERERQGLSLAEVSARTGMDKAALSRLENAANSNPKLDTLTRYADALGVELQITMTRGDQAA